MKIHKILEIHPIFEPNNRKHTLLKGYLLGMSDEYNICSGSAENVRTLTQGFIDNLLKPAMLTCTPDKFKLGQAILDSILVSTNRRLITFNGFMTYWCGVSFQSQYY